MGSIQTAHSRCRLFSIAIARMFFQSRYNCSNWFNKFFCLSISESISSKKSFWFLSFNLCIRFKRLLLVARFFNPDSFFARQIYPFQLFWIKTIDFFNISNRKSIEGETTLLEKGWRHTGHVEHLMLDPLKLDPLKPEEDSTKLALEYAVA